jgi:murein L,D-transpeptidase YcbB/YkuD
MLNVLEFVVRIGTWKIWRLHVMLLGASLALLLLLILDESVGAGAITDMPMRIRARIEGKTQIDCAGRQLENISWLQGIYEARQYRAAWTTDTGLSASGQAIAELLAGSTQEGFDPETYHLSLIRSLDAGIRNGALSPDRLVDLELLLTHGITLYYVHLSRGRVNPEVIDAFWASSARPEQDIASIIGEAIERGSLSDLLASASPVHPGFRRLRDALGFYRSIQEKGGWGQIPSGMKIQAGENDPRIPAIRKRLAFTDGPVSTQKAALHSLDAGLIEAIKRFQKRHGLHPDGVIGQQTILNMNVPVEDRIRQIELNLERWRWLNRNWGKRYLIVNIADYSLEAIDDGKVTLEMRVIVGQTYRRTPVFSERLRYITLNPFWNVPKKIAVEDKLPIIKKDPGYLLKHHIHVYSARDENGPEINPYTIDWSRLHADYFPYRLKQDPGARNALGRIKFLLPNKYAIYLHDSPQRELFRRTTRGYSSGCIRLEKPVDLAVEVLKNTPGWNQAKILSIIQSGVTTVIPVKEEIMVYLLYWTAWVDETGTIHFREDIYDRDRPLWIAIQDADKANERLKEVSLGNLVIKPDAS